jgi:hypothetical protein
MLTDVVEAPAGKDYNHHPQPQGNHSQIARAGHMAHMFAHAWQGNKSHFPDYNVKTLDNETEPY